MGAQQSTRRLTVINDEASGVIKVCATEVFTQESNKFVKMGERCLWMTPQREMNSNLKSVDVNVPGQWLTKAKKE